MGDPVETVTRCLFDPCYMKKDYLGRRERILSFELWMGRRGERDFRFLISYLRFRGCVEVVVCNYLSHSVIYPCPN